MIQKRTIEKAVRDFVETWAGDGGVTMFTNIPEAKQYVQWVGDHAVMVLTFDGSAMYSIMNGEFGWDGYNAFDKLLDGLGCCFERNYGWALTVYRK